MGREGVPGIDGDPGGVVCLKRSCAFFDLIIHFFSHFLSTVEMKGPPGDRGPRGPDGLVGLPVSTHR